MKFLFITSLFFFLSGLFFWSYRGCERISQDVLTVGLVYGLPLGSSSDLHEGFNWDVASFLGKNLHKQVKRKALLYTEIDEAIQAGTVDVVCASMNITEERLKKMAMVHLFANPSPYLTLLFWDSKYQSEVASYKHIRDLANFFTNYYVGVVKGVAWEQILRQNKVIKIKTYACEHDLMLGLERGEVATMLVGRVSADFFQKQNSNVWRLEIALDKPYGYGIGVALNKQRTELIKQIADTIQELKGDGTINMLQLKWFGKVY